jgi:hypothetical protein
MIYVIFIEWKTEQLFSWRIRITEETYEICCGIELEEFKPSIELSKKEEVAVKKCFWSKS